VLSAWTYAGRDWLMGNTGDDHLDGGAGRDKIYGGGGDDTCLHGEQGGC
jgi:Ca2+-binding RTX toxin-like protein